MPMILDEQLVSLYPRAVLCESLGEDVQLGHWLPYPVLERDQLDFTTPL